MDNQSKLQEMIKEIIPESRIYVGPTKVDLSVDTVTLDQLLRLSELVSPETVQIKSDGEAYLSYVDGNYPYSEHWLVISWDRDSTDL